MQDKEIPMKVRYIKSTKTMGCTNGKIYEVLSIEKGWYRIVDDTDEDYLYPSTDFEILKKGKHKFEPNFVIETNLTAKEHALIAEGMKEYEKNPKSFITLAEYKKSRGIKTE